MPRTAAFTIAEATPFNVRTSWDALEHVYVQR
jgi:hypothetical protein